MLKFVRNKFFLYLICLGFTYIFIIPWSGYFELIWENDAYSYLILMPFVSIYFFYEKHSDIFIERKDRNYYGIGPMLFGVLLCMVGYMKGDELSTPGHYSTLVLSLISFIIGGIGLFFGVHAWKEGTFPIAMLLFSTPFPPLLLNPIITFLQKWSAEMANVFFLFTGVPVYREGYVFYLPTFVIEVAKECSGIRSSISLFLLSLILGHTMLKDTWRKGVLVLLVFPITIIKNAFRIVVLSLLAMYVDHRVLDSAVHRRGGVPLFLLAMVLIGIVLWFLRRGERKEICS